MAMVPADFVLTRVKLYPSNPKYFVTDDGRVWSLIRRRFLRIHPDGQSYPHVCLGKRMTRKISRLVAETFLGEVPASMVVCHNDGNRSNNRLSNLRVDTQAGNIADKSRHGTKLIGERHPSARLTEADVCSIKRRLVSGERVATIARDYPSVSYWAISRIKHGKAWAQFGVVDG